MLPTPALTRPCSRYLPSSDLTLRSAQKGVHLVRLPRWRAPCPADGVSFVQKAQIPEKRNSFPLLRGRASKSDTRAATCVKSVPVTLKGERMWGLQSGGSPVYLPAHLRSAGRSESRRRASLPGSCRRARLPGAAPKPRGRKARGSHHPGPGPQALSGAVSEPGRSAALLSVLPAP